MNGFINSRFIILKCKYDNGIEYFNFLFENPDDPLKLIIFEFESLEKLDYAIKNFTKVSEKTYSNDIFNINFRLGYDENLGILRIIKEDEGVLKISNDYITEEKYIFEVHSKLLDGVYRLEYENETQLWIFKKL